MKKKSIIYYLLCLNLCLNSCKKEAKKSEGGTSTESNTSKLCDKTWRLTAYSGLIIKTTLK